MIEQYLQYGRQNAITGKNLARLLHCNIRDLTEQIEKDRRDGILICASLQSDRPGYYLAETKEDIAEYTETLKKRAINLFKTRQAIIKASANLPERK